MDAEIVNLRLARKRRDRLDREADAQRNRLAHGRSKAEREAERLAAGKAARDLDGHRLSPAAGDPPVPERSR